MKPYVIATLRQVPGDIPSEAFNVAAEYDTLPEAKKGVTSLAPGEYLIAHVLNPKVVVQPPPEATRNVVDFGTSTMAKGKRTAKPAKPPKK